MASPLADRIRPQTLDDIVGQRHLLAPGRALRRIIESGVIPNMIFYGPPGVGKTTLASLIARQTKRKLCKLNGTTASTADIREIVSGLDRIDAVNGVLLYLDEIQYFNKKQQQTLLEFLEDGSITMIASTTENPYFYVYGAILSRCTVFEFKSVEPSEVRRAVHRAFALLQEGEESPLVLEEGVEEHIANACGGDVRKAMNAVELASLSALPGEDGVRHVSLESARELTQKSAVRYDKDGDEHYDLISAFQKSMRGSDPDAAVYYLARMLYAGESVDFIARRIMICAAEDVGMANPQALVVATSAAQAVHQVGMPEAQIILSEAVIYVATSPKSNAACNAVFSAMETVKNTVTAKVPPHLMDSHYKGSEKLGHGLDYKYAHNYPNHYVEQQYLPDGLEDKVFYEPGDLGYEKEVKKYFELIKK